MNEFDDDEDNFFSELDLDEIMALEESHLESSDKENADAPPLPPLQKQGGVPVASKACGAGVEGDCGNTLFQTTPLALQKKRFKFFKSAPTPIRLRPPSPVPDVSVIEFEEVKEPEGRSATEGVVTEARVNAIPPARKIHFEPKADNEKDKDWKRFMREFEAQSRFRTPWFQSIPIMTLNISRCRSIVCGAREASQLVQFAKMLLSFLKELQGSTNEHDEFHADDSDDLHMDKGYYKDLIHLLELALVQLDRLIANSTTDSSNVDGMSLKESVVLLIKEILEQYILGNIDIGVTRIPELLATLHPNGLFEILETVNKTGNVDLLLPFCSKSRENLMLILKYFHSSNSSGFEQDPDFQVQPYHSSTKDCSSPSKLVANLLKSLFSANAVNVLPHPFQALVGFEYAISSEHPSLVSHKKIITELFSMLNDAIYQCAEDGVDEKLMQFVFSALPHTSKVLNDRTLAKQVKYKESPYLWTFLKERR